MYRRLCRVITLAFKKWVSGQLLKIQILNILYLSFLELPALSPIMFYLHHNTNMCATEYDYQFVMVKFYIIIYLLTLTYSKNTKILLISLKYCAELSD